MKTRDLKKKFFFIAFCVIIILIYPNTSLGADFRLPLQNPLNAGSAPELIRQITNYILGITSAVMLIVLIVAGFRYLTAGANEQRAEAAKNAIKWSLIGILVILITGIVVNSIILALKK